MCPRDRFLSVDEKKPTAFSQIIENPQILCCIEYFAVMC